MTYEELVRRDTPVLVSILQKLAILKFHGRKTSLDKREVEDMVNARDRGIRFDERRAQGSDKGEDL